MQPIMRTCRFVEARQLRAMLEAAETRLAAMKAQREAERRGAEGQAGLLTKTMGAMNKAVGYSIGSSEVGRLRMYVRIYVCMHVYKSCVDVHAYIRTCVHAYVDTCIRTYVHTCIRRSRVCVLGLRSWRRA